MGMQLGTDPETFNGDLWSLWEVLMEMGESALSITMILFVVTGHHTCEEARTIPLSHVSRLYHEKLLLIAVT